MGWGAMVSAGKCERGGPGADPTRGTAAGGGGAGRGKEDMVTFVS